MKLNSRSGGEQQQEKKGKESRKYKVKFKQKDEKTIVQGKKKNAENENKELTLKGNLTNKKEENFNSD